MGLFPIFPLNQLGEMFLRVGKETTSILVDAGATLSMLNPTFKTAPASESKDTSNSGDFKQTSTGLHI